MKMVYRLLAGFFLAAGSMPAVAGQIFWIGGGPPCNFQSLQIAIGAAPGGATLRIASNQIYDDVNVVIADKSLSLEGGYSDCDGTPSDEPVTIHGSPLQTLPVVRIVSAATPRSVSLNNLRIEGGRRSGIEVDGFVTLDLNNVVVDGNEANNGGGIKILGVSPEDTHVTLNRSVVGNFEAPATSGNLASASGGGVYCQHAHLALRGAVIRNNRAVVFGGGLYSDDCELSTPLSNFFTDEYGIVSAVIADNISDHFGGGIYAAGASALSFGPTAYRNGILGNSAQRGAGVYLTGTGTRLHGEGLDIDGNHAASVAGAAYVANAAHLELRRSSSSSLASIDPSNRVADAMPSGGLPRLRCVPALACNSVRFNSAETFTGSAFSVSDASITIAQTEIAGNDAGNGSAFILARSLARVENSLIHANESNGGDLIRMIDGSMLEMNSSTIASNATGSELIRLISNAAGNTVSLTNSIIWQPGTTAVASTPADIVQTRCVNAHESNSLAADTHNPGFVDSAIGNFRLSGNSPNIDACTDPFAETTTDLLGELRPVDLDPDNGAGMFDRGAYELPDQIFVDDLE